MGALALIALVLAAPGHGSIRAGSLSRRMSGTTGLPLLFGFAKSGGVGMGTECANANVTGTASQAMTDVRGSAQSCRKADGTIVSLSNAIPAVEYLNGVLGVYLETNVVNRCLRSRNMADAVWTKSSMTCAQTATDINGVANAASTCTATGAGGTALQAITIASASRSTSVYIKRRTGTGTISLTRDNGSTWIDVTSSVTSSWTRLTNIEYSGLTTTAANPTVGVKLTTNTDAVDLDYWQDENTAASVAYATRPIVTTSANVTRQSQAFYPTTWPIASGADWSVSYDFCAPTTAYGTATADLGTASLDLARISHNGTTGWLAICKTGDVSGSVIADTLTVGYCRHFIMRWTNSPRVLTAYVKNGSTLLGTSTCTSASGITTADRLWLGGAITTGAIFLSSHVSNLCIDTAAGGCQ